MSRLIEIIARQADAIPERIAVRAGPDELTYGMLPFAIAATAARINRIDPGHAPVAIDAGSGLAAILATLALRQLGRTAIWVPHAFPPAQREAAFAAAGASCVIGARGIRLLDGDAAPPPCDVALILQALDPAGTPFAIHLSEDDLLSDPNGGVGGRAASPSHDLLRLCATLQAGGEYRVGQDIPVRAPA